MAKKVILKDDNVEIMPITRGELILDSSGQLAFHSSQFLATQSLPGLMSGEDKIKLDSLEKVIVEDKKVEQVNTTTNNSYRILFSNSADDTTKTEGTRKSAKLLFNPSTGALTATALIGKLNWSNLNNVPENFTPAQHIHNTSEITALTSYSKATSASDLVTTDTLNAALGKLEYKADCAYTLVKGAYDGDGTIENLTEILKVLDGIKDTETIQAIVGKYLPLAGGMMVGNITFDVDRSIRWHQSDSYSISCPTDTSAAYLLLKGFSGTTINKRLSVYKSSTSTPNTAYSIYTDGSLYAAGATFGASVNMGSYDLRFKGSDPGDIAWFDANNNEKGRIYCNDGVLSLRHNAGTTYKILHTGNAGISNGTIIINGVSITPLTSHQSLANYVTLNGNQTISGVKTFSSQQKFTVADGTSPFTVTSTTKVSNLNADMVDGYHISTAGTTKPWSTIVTIGSDGVSEMGRYIDFHYDNTTGSDYSTRLQCGGNHSNTVTLPSATGTLALTSQIPSALKNPKKLTIFGVEYDGSTDKTVTAVTMISTLSEGSSNITDQTEILTSYASDNGFADTNAPNVVYKRDAVKLYNYINAKLAATYAGLNKTGTVTSVAISNGGGIGISGSPITSSGTIIISNAGVRSTTINGNYLRVNTNGTNTDLTIPYATLSSVVGDGTMNMIPQYNNEINFGGTNAAGNIYFGYRAVDSKPIPTNFIFGGADGSASVKASGFIKKGSSDSYVLLGGGGHKALSDFAMASAYVKKAGDTMTGRLTMNTTITDHSSPVLQCLVINSTAVPDGATLTLKNSPGIGFHISNYSWGSLVFNGNFNFINDKATSYMPVKASKFITNGGTSSLFVKGDGSLDSTSYATTSSLGNYLPLAGGTMKNSAVITLPASASIVHTTATSSNAVASLIFYKGTLKDSNYNHSAQIGWHNIGDTDGAIYLVPNPLNSNPWEGSVGLYIGKTLFKWNNNTIIHTGNYSTYLDSRYYTETEVNNKLAGYLPLSGGTMTGILSMKNDVNPRILFIPNSGSSTLGAIYLMGGSSTAYSGIKYKFRQWSYTANSLTRLSYYEDYNLPETPAGLTANASYTILTTKNASVSGGGSTWGSSITVKINGTTKTLTIPANPNTWRGITDSYSGTDSTISLSQKGGNALYNALVNGYASSAGNADTVDGYHASSFFKSYGTYGSGNSYDSDWGLSVVTFDPVVSGTYPENNPNITILNLGNNYARRKQLACTYNNNNIYYRRRIDSSWSEWVRLAIAGESYTKGDSDGRYYPISGNVNMSGDNKWIGSTMGGGTDYWRIGGSGTSDNGVCQITIGDNSNDYFQIVIADYTGTNYTALLVKAGGTYAPHFYENSDQRLKTNIQTILNKDNIPQIKEFDWKESGEHSYGLIAQELEDQGYSELVSTKDDGYKTVNYSAALSLIVGKLQVKIKELEKEIKILKENGVYNSN